LGGRAEKVLQVGEHVLCGVLQSARLGHAICVHRGKPKTGWHTNASPCTRLQCREKCHCFFFCSGVSSAPLSDGSSQGL
jgi:hypothetical protein